MCKKEVEGVWKGGNLAEGEKREKIRKNSKTAQKEERPLTSMCKDLQ